MATATERLDAPLARRLPAPGSVSSDEVLDRFLDYVTETGLTLYPAQEEALLEIAAGKNVILNTPTGSGKSLVAAAVHFKAMAEGRRSFYTSPIKALASEKFFSLCDSFGRENVGMLTGDAAINRDAPVMCCTAEVLANVALREGSDAPIDFVVMDEFHYYADRERGVAWEVPLLTLPHATFLLMSATIGNAEYFEDRLTRLTGRPTALVRSNQRPVPLDFEYRETPLHETVDDLVTKGKYPIYIVNFTQRACADEAQNLMSTNFCSKQDKQAISEALRDTRFDSPYGKEVQKFVRHGIGLHHAGLLPKYRLLVEKLSQRGLLKIISGTDTLGVGVNIPIRTVLFTKLCKFDGEKTGVLSVRDFRQISGRAGRKGFDNEGSVVVQAPEHVIENLRLEAKAAGDPAKLRKLVRRKPPEKNYVHWDHATFQRLLSQRPEDLVSRFTVTHGMLLNLLQGRSVSSRGGYGRMIDLIAAAGTDERTKRTQRQTARVLFRSLHNAGLIELVPREGRPGKLVQISPGLDEDFSLHHALSLYLIDTLDKLDPDADGYPLDVLTLVESIIENPDAVLYRQLDLLKTRRMEELKAEGVEYEQRIEELEKLEYPKPQREFIYGTFNEFARRHPWVGQENIRPKSVAREMYENFYAFDDYVKEYGLQRSEGLLLRYLSDVYKALVQNVPERYKTQEVLDAIAFMRTTVRGVDSSLLDEWEGRDSRPSFSPLRAAAQTQDQGHDPRAFRARVQSEIHRLLKALASRDYDRAERCVRPGDGSSAPWTPQDLEREMAPYFTEYEAIVLDQEARSGKYTFIEQMEEHEWRVTQTIVDPEKDNLWTLDLWVDLDRPGEPSDPIIELRKIHPA